MRLVVVELHRAFAELDRFDDATCRGYIREARRQHRVAMLLVQAAGLGVSLMLAVAALIAAGLAMSMASSAVNDDWSPIPVAVGGVVLIAGMLLAGWALYAIRDAGLREAIRKRLVGARCGMCGYSLLGLSVKDGAVCCPECGAVERLEDRGLTAEDILADRASADQPVRGCAPGQKNNPPRSSQAPRRD